MTTAESSPLHIGRSWTQLGTFGFRAQVASHLQKSGNRILCNLQDEPDRAFVREELMHFPEDAQVPLEWVSNWK